MINKKRSKKAQGAFGMSFGMMFSIILIIFFVAVAFTAIKGFLNTQKCAQIGMFKADLQDEVDKTWNSNNAQFEFKTSLPRSIEYVCFMDLDKSVSATGVMGDIGDELGLYEGYVANMFLYPTENACDMVAHDINHLDLDEITSTRNPNCISVEDGVVKIPLKMGFGERLVTIG